MKPLKKGAARSGLAAGLAKVAQAKFHATPSAPLTEVLPVLSQAQAAVLGGAIEAALDDCLGGQYLGNRGEFKRDFWRLTNENLWRLTRTLEASLLIDPLGED